uniref:Molybdopterin biosynthesis protein n=1 Tax=Neoizziella asiatica TaxID=1077397 RepID=A0A1G4NX78_9FLOR|nr:Molybdopterin biosynthesis protein [Neoizziella asiatica]SCW23268.1 Molybdopterin biosynthesis protein [Neoizziella asiatica]
MSKYFSNIKSQPFNLSLEEHETYAKHIIIPEIQHQGQNRLKQSRILSIGAGALASSSLLYLASSGIGNLGIIDGDYVERSNLHRQLLYRRKDIGCSKSESAKKHLSHVNPFCNIKIFNFRFHPSNAHKIVQKYDIILDNTDNFETRLLISRICQELHKIHIYGAVSTFDGHISIFNYQGGPHYHNLNQLKQSGQDHICNDNGILGILPGIIGMLQATETIKVVLGLGTISSGQLITYNLLHNSFRKVSIRQQYQDITSKFKHTSEIQGITLSLHQLHQMLLNNKPIYLIDIRDQEEYETEHIIHAINIPLYKLKKYTNQQMLINQASQKIIVVYCNSITRSRLASILLFKQSIHHFTLRL